MCWRADLSIALRVVDLMRILVHTHLSHPDGAGEAKRHRTKRSSRKALGRLAVGLHGSSVLEECRFIPLRLDARERGLLAMLKGALNISEYTDRQEPLWAFCSPETLQGTFQCSLPFCCSPAFNTKRDAQSKRDAQCEPSLLIVCCPLFTSDVERGPGEP